jgi:adenylosuccinate synthase
VLRTAAILNGLDEIALTKLDVLDEFDEIKVAVAYESDGRRVDEVPPGARALERCRPVWKSFRGWNCETGAARRWRDLPAAARDYLEWIERECGVPIESVSVGAARDAAVSRS